MSFGQIIYVGDLGDDLKRHSDSQDVAIVLKHAGYPTPEDYGACWVKWDDDEIINLYATEGLGYDIHDRVDVLVSRGVRMWDEPVIQDG